MKRTKSLVLKKSVGNILNEKSKIAIERGYLGTAYGIDFSLKIS